jgi:SseB protein N-terminal domain
MAMRSGSPEELADMEVVFVLVEGEDLKWMHVALEDEAGSWHEVLPVFSSQERVEEALARNPDWPRTVFGTSGRQVLETLAPEVGIVLDL